MLKHCSRPNNRPNISQGLVLAGKALPANSGKDRAAVTGGNSPLT